MKVVGCLNSHTPFAWQSAVILTSRRTEIAFCWPIVTRPRCKTTPKTCSPVQFFCNTIICGVPPRISKKSRVRAENTGLCVEEPVMYSFIHTCFSQEVLRVESPGVWGRWCDNQRSTNIGEVRIVKGKVKRPRTSTTN